MAKVFRINGFDRKKKLLVEKIQNKGCFVTYKTPVAISIADFDARLNGELVPKTIHITGAMGIGSTLHLYPVEDLGSIGLCTSDLYDGDDMTKLLDAIDNNGTCMGDLNDGDDKEKYLGKFVK